MNGRFHACLVLEQFNDRQGHAAGDAVLQALVDPPHSFSTS